MRHANLRFNYSDYSQLPENKRYEILEGDLIVVPAPDTRHQRVSRNLEEALYRYVESRQLGEVFHAPYDVVLSDETIVQPDILFVHRDRAAAVAALNLKGAPDLIVEILSESSRRRDLDIKKKIYARYGVREYWIVDPNAETIQVLAWSDQGYVEAGLYRQSERLSSPLLSEIDLPISEVFQEPG